LSAERRAIMRLSATAGGVSTALDPGALLRGLILFDQIIVESNSLQEIPLLIDWFGFDPVMHLLTSERISFQPIPLTVGETGSLGLSGRPVLPRLQYRLLPITIPEPERHTSRSVDEWPETDKVGQRMRQKLVAATYRTLVRQPPLLVSETEAAVAYDLQNIPLLKQALHDAIAEAMGIRFDVAELTVGTEPVDETGWHIETNLSAKFGLSVEREHQYVTRAILNCAGLSQRLVMRRQYAAIPELPIGTMPLLNARLLTFLGPYNVPAERFERVVTLAGLPSVSRDIEVSLDRVLDVTSGDEARRFREWLHSVDPTDEEVLDALTDLRSRIAGRLRSPLGRLARFVVSQGLTLVSPAPGVAGALADTWLLEWALGPPSPLLFLTRSYGRLFPEEHTIGARITTSDRPKSDYPHGSSPSAPPA